MEENILKQKYNELLERYKKGAQYLVDHPEEEKKINAELNKIEAELSKIIEALPNMTDEERTEGFKIEQADVQTEQVSEQVSEQVDSKQIVVKQDPTPTTNLSTFSDNWKIATQLAKSTLLPDDFKNRPENVMIALSMAQKMQMDPFTICQNLHIIRGKLSWSGAFCKTLIEQSGKYTDLDFVYFGEEGTDFRGCYLEATRIRDGKRIKGNKVTVKLAKDEKWYNTNSKWQNMTDQMLRLSKCSIFC
jgi:hypothetical protein